MSNRKKDKILLCLKPQSTVNKRYLHNQCPESSCSVYFPSSLRTQKNHGAFFLLSLNSPHIQLNNTRSYSASSHEDGEGQESERSKKGRRDTETLLLAGSAPAIQRICIHMRDFVAPVFVGLGGFWFCFWLFFFFLLKTIIPAKAGCAKLILKNHHSV